METNDLVEWFHQDDICNPTIRHTRSMFGIRKGTRMHEGLEFPLATCSVIFRTAMRVLRGAQGVEEQGAYKDRCQHRNSFRASLVSKSHVRLVKSGSRPEIGALLPVA